LVATALSYLHHPLRAATSEKYLRQSLELVEEIQLTGDIFFPTNWLQSTFGSYNTNLWLPHITLALGDMTPQLLGPVLGYLNQYNFNWEITLDNLVILQKCGDYFLKEEEFRFGRPELIF
jgi:hypothetical protein